MGVGPAWSHVPGLPPRVQTGSLGSAMLSDPALYPRRGRIATPAGGTGVRHDFAAWGGVTGSREGAQPAPPSPACGAPLQSRGAATRELQTHAGQEITLTRSYGTCSACGAGLFPLDEELGLLPGSLTPRLHEQLVRLGSWMEFRPAATLLAAFTGAQVTEAT